MVMEKEEGLGLLLIVEKAAVLGSAFGFFKDDLTDGGFRVNGQRHGAGIGHFQNLFSRGTGMDEVSGDVNHEADSG